MRRRGGAAALATVTILLGSSIHAAPDPGRSAACRARPSGVPAARLAALSRGVNLTGWLEVPDGIAPDPTALRQLRGRGFTHLRLPVTAERYLAEFSDPGDVGPRLDELGRAVNGLIHQGFAISLDMHPGAEIGALRASDPPRARRLLEDLWRRLARRFADRSPDHLFFEMLNEPTSPAEYGWSLGFARIVRAIAPNHTLIVGPSLWQRIEALEEVVPLADRNVVYAIHVYDPMAFTHQGIDWAPAEDPLRAFSGVPYPSRPDHPAVLALRTRLVARGNGAAAAALSEQMKEPWDAARIEGIFARADAWAVRASAAVIVNEFGVLAAHAPPTDRARWIADVRRSAERHCVGWTHWDYAEGFGLMRRTGGGRETPDPAILDALVAP